MTKEEHVELGKAAAFAVVGWILLVIGTTGIVLVALELYAMLRS